MFLDNLAEVLLEGVRALSDYFTGEEREVFFLFRRVISLTIAFALSGAIVALMSPGAVLQYFGPETDKRISYLVASVSGAILAVCSCSVLPMFASIRKKGAGIGPAVTFLFSGPAVNVLAVVLTFSFFGLAVGFVRIVGAVAVSLVIGILMYLIWQKKEKVTADQGLFTQEEEERRRKVWQSALFFLVLLGMLIGQYVSLYVTLALSIALVAMLIFWFELEELKEWARATGDLAKRIIPLFIVGIFIAGIVGFFLTEDIMVPLAGTNTYARNLLAGTFGAFMYFATLTEIPIVQAFLESGMHLGPATALLLAGPSLSLPNMIVIAKVLGIRRSFTYFLLVILLSAVVGLSAGIWIYG